MKEDLNNGHFTINVFLMRDLKKLSFNILYFEDHGHCESSQVALKEIMRPAEQRKKGAGLWAMDDIMFHKWTCSLYLMGLADRLTMIMMMMMEQLMYWSSLTTAGDHDGSRAEQFARGLPGEAAGDQDQHVRGSSAHDGWAREREEKSQRERRLPMKYLHNSGWLFLLIIGKSLLHCIQPNTRGFSSPQVTFIPDLVNLNSRSQD